jgi:hypothetical protein
MRTDGLTNITKLTVTFHNPSNASKKKGTRTRKTKKKETKKQRKNFKLCTAINGNGRSNVWFCCR